MKTLIYASDLHIGAVRSAGTTPLTQWQLRQYLLEEFKSLLKTAENSNLFINGDWLDDFSIPASDLLAVYSLTSDWLRANPLSWLGASRGNHDASKSTMVLSSFDLLVELLRDRFGEQVRVFTEPGWLCDGMYVVPHAQNTDIFDVQLQAVPECDYLFLHCCYESPYAVHSDHSLNLTAEQAVACKAKKIIIGHEHQKRTGLNGRVLLPGNAFPSSISDCLGNAEKFALHINGKGVELVRTWTAAGNYAEQDWRSLSDGTEKFIRVVGEASADEAADVVTAISKFRNKSKALVITNAVKVEGAADGEQIQLSMEEVKSFNVLEALLECLDEREQGVVKGLLKAEAA